MSYVRAISNVVYTVSLVGSFAYFLYKIGPQYGKAVKFDKAANKAMLRRFDISEVAGHLTLTNEPVATAFGLMY